MPVHPAASRSVSPGGRGDAEDFYLYYDRELSRLSPYHCENHYFNKAKDRMDRTFDLIRSNVEGSRILDVGASPFYLLYKAQQQGARECHGIYFANDDHPMRGINEIYSRHGAIQLHHSDIEKSDLPFPDNSFDIVTACEVLEHLENFPMRFVHEVRRILRPGGILCVTVPNVSAIGNIVKLVFRKNIYYKYRSDPTGRHKHEYTLRQVTALFEFMKLDVLSAGYFPSPTSDLRWLRPAYRLIAVTPGLRHYSPNIYCVGRQPSPKPAGSFGPPPKILYSDDLSIEE
ncbi:class I SAM-dependent methyltransferase [Roseomonas sp. BN140053]|uniref:class I SAM-dependent methyltransferase n=1 Tax=Roseomonas sp. BN140053 TaxID=3391898 RepID=UPI0039EAE89D